MTDERREIPEFMRAMCTGTPDGKGQHVWELREIGEPGTLAKWCVVCGALPTDSEKVSE